MIGKHMNVDVKHFLSDEGFSKHLHVRVARRCSNAFLANEYLGNEYLTNEDTPHYRREMFNIVIIVLKWSGISSLVVDTLAGQAVMEGLLGTKVNVWIRRIVTRFVNVIPTTITLLLEYVRYIR